MNILNSEIKNMPGPAKAWETIENFQIKFVKSKGLLPHHNYVDVGCGPLRGGYPIIEYLDSWKYFGCDVNPKAIEIAKQRTKGKEVFLRVGSFNENNYKPTVGPNGAADFIMAYSVFIHMEDDILMETLREIKKVLKPETGVCYANVDVITGKEGNWNGFPKKYKPKEEYEEMIKNSGLSMEWLEMEPWERDQWFRHEVLVIKNV